MREVAPVAERIRDYGGIFGACGASLRAMHAAAHNAPVVLPALLSGATWAGLMASFIGLRHLIMQEGYHEDREGVTGLALGIVSGGYTAVAIHPRLTGRAALFGFAGGCGLHYAHRWWLHYRLAWNMGWRPGDGWFEE